VVTSPLSLERCSAFLWRRSGRVASLRAVSQRQALVERSVATGNEQTFSPRTAAHRIGEIGADSEGIGESTGDLVVPFLSPRTLRARVEKAWDIVASTRRSERGSDGPPMGRSGA
jgi:hypothetical protein